MPRHEAGIIEAGAAQPLAQISSDCGDAVEPYAFDRRRQVVVIAIGHFPDHGIELALGAFQPVRPYRQQMFAPERAKSSN